MSANSGRNILSGQRSGGYPIVVDTSGYMIHACVDSTSQMDSIYVYALPHFSSSNVQISVTCLGLNSIETTLTSRVIDPSVINAPMMVLNGASKNNSSRIYAKTTYGKAIVFGFYSRTIIDMPISVRSSIGHLILGTQTLTFVGTETQTMSAEVPITFLITNHVSTVQALALLPVNVQAGTTKIIIMTARHHSIANSDTDSGNVIVKPARARFPPGTSDAIGLMKFQVQGESVTLVFTGEMWMISHVGMSVQ